MEIGLCFNGILFASDPVDGSSIEHREGKYSHICWSYCDIVKRDSLSSVTNHSIARAFASEMKAALVVASYFVVKSVQARPKREVVNPRACRV